MSSEYINKRKSIGSQALSVAAFPIGTATISGLKSVARNHGVKNAISSLNKDGFKALNNNLRGLNADTFSRNLILSSKYDEYSKLAKQAKKLQKFVDKDKIPFIDRILNPFRKIFFKNKVVTKDTIATRLKDTQSNLNSAKTALESKDAAQKLLQGSKNGLFKNLGSNIKQGFKDPIIWVFTALETIPEITGKVIPTFKEKGFKEGMKEVGKTTVKTFANVGTYVASSAIGRAIGMAIGSFLCPGAGTSVGGNIGSMVAVSLGNILKGKIFNKAESETKTPQKQTFQRRTAQNKTFQTRTQPTNKYPRQHKTFMA